MSRANRLKIGDYIVIAAVLCIAAALFLGFVRKPVDFGKITITSGRNIMGTIPLPEHKTVALDTLEYPCRLEIDGHRVRVIDSTCPGHDCERMGWMTAGAIICLPNELVIEFSGTAEGGIDAVAR